PSCSSASYSLPLSLIQVARSAQRFINRSLLGPIGPSRLSNRYGHYGYVSSVPFTVSWKPPRILDDVPPARFSFPPRTVACSPAITLLIPKTAPEVEAYECEGPTTRLWDPARDQPCKVGISLNPTTRFPRPGRTVGATPPLSTWTFA